MISGLLQVQPSSVIKATKIDNTMPSDATAVATVSTTSMVRGSNNRVTQVMLYRVPIVALVIDGFERLCLAQISSTLLKEFSYNEIHNRRVALGITCVQCTPVQLEILRRAGAMPISSRRCGMITKREAERLCKSFLGDNNPPKLPENFAFDVYHKCAWGCRGSFMPSRYNSSRAKCIKCAYCNIFFSPNKFIFHSHRLPTSVYVQPDAANFNSWRRHLKLSGETEISTDLVYAWEDVKAMFNGGSRKRGYGTGSTPSSSCSRSSTPQVSKRSRQVAPARSNTENHPLISPSYAGYPVIPVANRFPPSSTSYPEQQQRNFSPLASSHPAMMASFQYGGKIKESLYPYPPLWLNSAALFNTSAASYRPDYVSPTTADVRDTDSDHESLDLTRRTGTGARSCTSTGDRSWSESDAESTNGKSSSPLKYDTVLSESAPIEHELADLPPHPGCYLSAFKPVGKNSCLKCPGALQCECPGQEQQNRKRDRTEQEEAKMSGNTDDSDLSDVDVDIDDDKVEESQPEKHGSEEKQPRHNGGTAHKEEAGRNDKSDESQSSSSPVSGARSVSVRPTLAPTNTKASETIFKPYLDIDKVSDNVTCHLSPVTCHLGRHTRATSL